MISGPEGVRKWNRLHEKYLEKELETRNEKSKAGIKKAEKREEKAAVELKKIKSTLSKKKRELESLQEEHTELVRKCFAEVLINTNLHRCQK